MSGDGNKHFKIQPYQATGSELIQSAEGGREGGNQFSLRRGFIKNAIDLGLQGWEEL